MLKRNETAPFDLLTYFEGLTLAAGVFESRSGMPKRRFTVEMTGRAEGNTLVLAEDFLFDDGERQARTWRLTRTGPDRFTGTCEDSVEDARGSFADGMAHFVSTLRLKVGARHIAMRFDDVYYDLGDGAVLNRTTVSKWGIRLGQVLISFRKP